MEPLQEAATTVLVFVSLNPDDTSEQVGYHSFNYCLDEYSIGVPYLPSPIPN